MIQRRHTDGQQAHEKMINAANHQRNANQKEITSHLSEWLPSKSVPITNIDKDVEKREPSHTAGGNVNWLTMETYMEMTQETKYSTTI